MEVQINKTKLTCIKPPTRLGNSGIFKLLMTTIILSNFVTIGLTKTQSPNPRCEDIVVEISHNLETKDESQAAKLLPALATACASANYPTVAYCTGRSIALAHYEKAVELSKTNANQSEVLRTLNTGLRYGRPWQLLFARGEIEKSTERYSAAALSFSAAIDEFSQPITCQDEESIITDMTASERTDLAKSMLRNAEYNLLRAKWLPAESKYRCCKPSGPLQENIRGYAPEERNFRIDFVRLGSRLARDGELGLQRLERYLAQRQLTTINLTVHTEKFKNACVIARERANLIKTYFTSLHPDWNVTINAAGDASAFTASTRDDGSPDKIPRILLTESSVITPTNGCK